MSAAQSAANSTGKGLHCMNSVWGVGCMAAHAQSQYSGSLSAAYTSLVSSYSFGCLFSFHIMSVNGMGQGYGAWSFDCWLSA
jgi:hypothetical protein